MEAEETEIQREQRRLSMFEYEKHKLEQDLVMVNKNIEATKMYIEHLKRQKQPKTAIKL